MTTSTNIRPVQPDRTPTRSGPSPEPRPLALLPLRLFLGVTFVYAGVQKLTDPQFFQPDSPGYIGQQIATFAQTSPLRPFLLNFAEQNAVLFGLFTAYGEIAIGLGALVGLLLRPASFFGLLLNILLWLSASWSVYPYFYGSDIVFACGWLVLLLNGPSGSGWLTLDEILFVPRLARYIECGQYWRARAMAFLLGLPISKQALARATPYITSSTRRGFLWGLFTGGVATAFLVSFGSAFLATRQGGETAKEAATAAPSSSPTPTQEQTTPPGSSQAIAQVSEVPLNGALAFIDTESGDPALLIHLADNQFVAYSAVCTHAGCTVDYDPDSKLIVCPCHGATYDPTQNAAVLRPPARRALTPIAIHIDSATGTIQSGE